MKRFLRKANVEEKMLATYNGRKKNSSCKTFLWLTQVKRYFLQIVERFFFGIEVRMYIASAKSE